MILSMFFSVHRLDNDNDNDNDELKHLILVNISHCGEITRKLFC